MKRTLFLLVVFIALQNLSGFCEESRREVLSAYDSILDMVIDGLSGNEEIQETNDFNASMVQCALSAGTDPMKSVGMEYLDLDGDGTPELILGQTENEWEDRFLFDIWALQGRKPVLVARGWERNRLYLTYDFVSETYGLYNEGSNSAFESIWRTGTIRNGKVIWEHTLIFNSESAEIWTLDGNPIPEDRGESLSEQWKQNLMDPELFFLSAREEAKLEFGSEGDFPGFSEISNFQEQAEDEFAVCGRVSESESLVTIRVKDTGEFTGAIEEPDHVLEVSVIAEDGSTLQTFTYASIETPRGLESRAGMHIMRFTDINCDGYRDLVLITAVGVYNEYCVLSLWNPKENRFDPLMSGSRWDFENERFENEIIPLELCNMEIWADKYGFSGAILSSERDGCAHYQFLAYRWEVSDYPTLVGAFEVFDAGNDRIGDRMYLFENESEKCWEHVYPESWYYGETDVYGTRKKAFLKMLWDTPETAKVTKTNWVNLREMDTKQSRSLAKLNAGEEVHVLYRDASPGWDLVLWDTGVAEGPFSGNHQEIGYIQNRFLTK